MPPAFIFQTLVIAPVFPVCELGLWRAWQRQIDSSSSNAPANLNPPELWLIRLIRHTSLDGDAMAVHAFQSIRQFT